MPRISMGGIIFVIGLDYSDIAEQLQLKYDAVRMKIGRCLEAARTLLTA